MNDGSFSSTFQVLPLARSLVSRFFSSCLAFLPTAIHINVYFYRHQADINSLLCSMACIDVCKIVWGDLEMINDMSARNWVGTGREREWERENSICHKNENCFTRQLTLHSIFLAETAHSLVWHWSLSAIYQKRLLTRFSKHFKRHWN